MIISDNGISKVWRDGYFAFKQQPKFLTDNEIYCLNIMYSTGYVPYAEQVDVDTIKVQWIYKTAITNTVQLAHHFERVLEALAENGLRHGDLTRPNIIISNDKPFIIDWAESRLACDPRPDKRREGDAYWLNKTLKDLMNASQ